MTAMWGILLYVALGLAAVGAIRGAHRLREHARWLKRMGLRLTGETQIDFCGTDREHLKWRMVCAVEPRLDGAATGAGLGAQGRDGFDREGEAGEVSKPKRWWVTFFGPAS